MKLPLIWGELAEQNYMSTVATVRTIGKYLAILVRNQFPSKLISHGGHTWWAIYSLWQVFISFVDSDVQIISYYENIVMINYGKLIIDYKKRTVFPSSCTNPHTFVIVGKHCGVEYTALQKHFPGCIDLQVISCCSSHVLYQPL